MDSIKVLTQKFINAKTLDETKILFETGLININAKDEYGNTALIMAPTLEQTDYLIKNKAYVNAKNNLEKNALMSSDIYEQSKLLIEAGIDINAIDSRGNHAFTYHKDINQIELLMESGMDVNHIKDGLRNLEHFHETKLLIYSGAGVDINVGVAAVVIADYNEKKKLFLEAIKLSEEPKIIIPTKEPKTFTVEVPKGWKVNVVYV